MNKKQQQTEDTKRRIAEAAQALFMQKGYKSTSIEEIVEATGSSKGNIYYHFKSKEGLFLYLVEEWDLEWEQKWNSKEQHYTTTVDKLYGIADQLVFDDLNHPFSKALDEFINSNGDVSEEVEQRIVQIIRSHLEFNQKLLQQGMDRGEFENHNVEQLSVIFESLIVGLSQMSRITKVENALALYHAAIKVFLHGIEKKS
ncbi:TetR/AcrR family transcriptional regulator [Paenibacillus lautus]|uniref:TetR/AcrR family transcriptional regulator n=1 Tax=Paenibacillus lautus TaxID=1401 RepID=UPI001C11DE12|nr:TetR/AcrR family transcriptional regulator [Paenibacillus lautus]